MDIKVIKKAYIYAPEEIGLKDILVIGNKIARIDDNIDEYDDIKDAEIIDAEGNAAVPGYIDMHEHITGGGGEQGPASRVPEAMLSLLTRYGITTVVGLLGTDGITRSVENLVAKAQALNEEGITAYALTGSYGYPSQTVTGSVEKDIVMISPIIGVKIAVSDHRSSNPSGDELIDIATQARRAGLLSNRPGLLTLHMGSGKAGLDPVLYAIDNSDVPLKNFLPTHMLRTHRLMEQGAELIRKGGYIDCTAGSDEKSAEKQTDKLIELLSWEGVTADHITLSSDAFGSQPKFDAEGRCIGLTYSSPEYLHKTIKLLINKGIPVTEALKLLTATPAEVLGKKGIKGGICEGGDADILIMDQDFNINSVIAKGNIMVLNKNIIVKGRFE